MPKSFVLGNGKILVGLDKFGQVRDFYFPHVGLENHVGGRFIHRVGVFADPADGGAGGRLEWLDNPNWRMMVDCANETLASNVVARNEKLGLELFFNDVVYNEQNIFIRKVLVHNLASSPRTIKLFFHHEFQISGSTGGDTAYFEPAGHTIVHYKGRRLFMANVLTDVGEKFDDWTTGIFGIEGKEGSFRDAEDGKLAKNPIEHGQADSVIGLSLALEASASRTIWYWLSVGETFDDVRDANRLVLEKSPQHMINTTQSFWHAWVNRRNFSFYGLDDKLVEVFKKSLFYIRAHCDWAGGILASSDSDMLNYGRDTYNYVWPRDASRSALALVKAGDFDVAKRFFEFINEIITQEGFVLHKYRPDKSLGSSWHPWERGGRPELPIQEDETAVVLVALWQYYQLSRDLEFIEAVYNSLIKAAAEFMVAYRDEDLDLPHSSYDLWEEKYGVHTYTAASVVGALSAAANFAELLGKEKSARRWRRVAENISETIVGRLFNPRTNYFYKSIIHIDASKRLGRGGMVSQYDETIDASSFFGLIEYGVLKPTDELAKKVFETLESKLCCQTPIGGVPRYQGDQYYRSYEDVPGNPWMTTTMWLAQHYIRLARSEEDMAPVKKWLAWAADRAMLSGVMSEQIDPYTGEQISAAPLTWSHAEYVLTVIRYLDKLEELGICKACNPVD